MDDRLFDRNNYSSKTIEIFEIMSAYFVDIFYNHLYIEAKKLKASGNVASVTEGYKHTLNAFLKGLENPKLYKKSIVGIHHYFITVGFASISFAKCVDKLTQEFIPTDYFNSLTVTQKMGVLRMVLNQTIKNFIRKIVDEHMAKIIDYHTEKDNVRILQDELIDCFILEREGMFQRFIAENTKTNKNETVNRLLAEKMQIEIKRLVKEKYEQQKQIIALKKMLLNKKTGDNKIREYIGNLRSEIESLKKKEKPQKNSSSNEFVIQTNSNTQTHQSFQQPKQQHQQQPQQQVKPQLVTRNRTDEKIEVISHDNDNNSDDNVDNNDNNDIDNESVAESSFVEVNSNNIHNILQGDAEDLHKLNNTKMDEGTSLDDFSL